MELDGPGAHLFNQVRGLVGFVDVGDNDCENVVGEPTNYATGFVGCEVIVDSSGKHESEAQGVNTDGSAK